MGPSDGSSLCQQCGICCGWSIFDRVALEPAEVPWAATRRLPILQSGTKSFFEVPCSVLEARGDARVCGDYEHRPAACRSFECKILKRHQSGELSLADARAKVAEARALIASVEECIAGTADSDSRNRHARLWAALHAGPEGTRGLPPRALLDLGILQSLVIPSFHDLPKAPEPLGPDADAVALEVADEARWQQLLAPLDALSLDLRSADEDGATEAARDLCESGYAELGAVLSTEEASHLATVFPRLEAAGWPPVFVFMHPAVWGLPRRLDPWLRPLLGDGYDLLSAFWAWHLRPGGSTEGWGPHRDRDGITVADDGRPSSVTVWIALTNATPENGCMYLLPPRFDPYYGRLPKETVVHDPQNVRAFPAAAGCAVAWNHQLLHWGGRMSPRAREPRISVAFEFRRRGATDDLAVIDRARLPTFDERISLIVDQIRQYKRFGGVREAFVAFASQRAFGKAGDR